MRLINEQLMKVKHYLLRFSAIVVTVAVAAIGIRGYAAGPKDQPLKTELNVRLWYSEAKVFDPTYTNTAPEYYVTKNLFNGLVAFKPGSSEIQPDLAESWRLSADGKVITFQLRKGVKFHKNYGEMTSEDAAFTFERLKDPKCELSPIFKGVIKSIETPDKYTIKMTLNKVYVPLFTLLAYRNAFILSKKAVTELGPEFKHKPIGTGPFVFQEMTPDKKVIVTGNKEYFKGAPTVTKITFHPIIEDETAAMALERGELDIIWTRGDAAIAERLAARKDITVKKALTTTIRFVPLNPKYAPLANQKVRQALAYGLNRQAISEATGGFEQPAKSIYNPLYFAYTEDVPQYSYNPEKAKVLLSEAGYKNGFDLALLVSTASPQPTVAQVIQESWRGIGVRVKINAMEQGAYTEARDKGNYQAVLIGQGRPPDPDLILMAAFISTAFPPGWNNAYYSGADEMILKAASEADPRRRAAQYREIAAKILTDMPDVPVTNCFYAAAWRLPVIDYLPGIINEFDAYTIKLGDRKPQEK